MADILTYQRNEGNAFGSQVNCILAPDSGRLYEIHSVHTQMIRRAVTDGVQARLAVLYGVVPVTDPTTGLAPVLLDHRFDRETRAAAGVEAEEQSHLEQTYLPSGVIVPQLMVLSFSSGHTGATQANMTTTYTAHVASRNEVLAAWAKWGVDIDQITPAKLPVFTN